jgi:hypothetical protein
MAPITIFPFSFASEPPPPSIVPLQEVTWEMTDDDQAVVTRTGVEIIDSRTNSLLIGAGPRLWNGNEANNFGAANKAFPNPGGGAACGAWWQDNYWGRMRQNGRDWIIMQNSNDVFNISTQPSYNNWGGVIATWDYRADQFIGNAESQVMEFEIYNKDELGSNWYDFQEGAVALFSMTQTEQTLDFTGSKFPSNTTITKTLFSGGASYSSSPYDRLIRSQFTGDNQAAVDAMSDYIAIWVSPSAATGGFGEPATSGWYVFGNKRLEASRASWDVVAWPTGGATGDGSQACMSNVTDVTPWVALSDYTGDLGNGGTDDWSPPFGTILDSVSYQVTGELGTYSGDPSNRFEIADRDDAGSMDQGWWQEYTFGEFRRESDTRLRWMLKKTTGQPWSDTQSFAAGTTLTECKLMVDSQEVPFNSVSLGGSGQNLEIYFDGTGYNTLWGSFSAGMTVQLHFNYVSYTNGEWDLAGVGAQAAATTVAASADYFNLARVDGLSSNRYRLWTDDGSGGITYPEESNGDVFPPFLAIYKDGWGVYEWDGVDGSSNRYGYVGGINFDEQNNTSPPWHSGKVYFLSDYLSYTADKWAPPYGWSAYQLGMGMINEFSTNGGNTIAFDLGYPDLTGANAYEFNGSNSGGGTWPYLYGPRSRFATVGDKADMPPYAAIYISAAEAASGLTQANAEGWYVFGPGIDDNPGNSGYIEYAPNPLAWPSASNSTDGLLGVNNGYSAHTVWLSDYTGGTGVGATDSWTEPPMVAWPLSTYQGAGSDISIHWRSNNGNGVFINQVNVPGMELMYVYDNSGLTKRGIQIGFDTGANRDAWIANYTGTWQVSIEVTEAGHPNFGTTYTYQWPMPATVSSYVWDATTAMLKWQWRLDSTPVPADGNDNLYGNNPRVIQELI